MFAAGAVAALAFDAEYKAGRVLLVRRWGKRSEVASVALEATRVYRAVEAHGAVFVAGTVDPVAAPAPPGDRKLKQLIALPVQVSLRFAHADDDIETLAELDVLARRYLVHRGLMKSVCVGGHF